jgi:exonuclease III
MNILKKWIVLCWNIRGLNAKSKQLALMNAINLSGCSVVCLQETKKCDFDINFIKSCCPKRFDDFVFIPSDGASGGLILIWDSSIFSGMIMHYEPFAASVHFSSTQSSQSLTLVNIYGPCSGDMRYTFTQWLFNLNIPPDEDWLLLGDFNFIRSLDNRNKPGGNINDMLLFNDFIRAQNLTELPIKGRKYTWSNMQDDPLLEQ